MELTEKRRSETWAFYTPRIRADLAVKTMQEEIGNLTDYIFYDPACGEWALLEALPEGVMKFGTTLEHWDVAICKRKGLEATQMDFLTPEAEEKLISLANLFERISKPLVIFTNPPYFRLKKDQYPEIKKQYWSYDSVELFYRRAIDLLYPKWICWFNKIDLYQTSWCAEFRDETWWVEKTKKLIMTRSKTWWLKGDFAVVFNIVQMDVFPWFRNRRAPILADRYDGKESGTYDVYCHF